MQNLREPTAIMRSKAATNSVAAIKAFTASHYTSLPTSLPQRVTKVAPAGGRHVGGARQPSTVSQGMESYESGSRSTLIHYVQADSEGKGWVKKQARP